jgi:hypothetical protein
MSFESDLELRVGAQHPEQFERMMFDRVHEHPTANRLQPPDARESRSTPGSGGSARASLIGIRIPPPGSGARYPDTTFDQGRICPTPFCPGGHECSLD